MTGLDSALADYLGVRRAVGYQLHEVGRRLEEFVAHLNGCEIETVTVAVAVDWARTVGQYRGVRVGRVENLVDGR